MLNNIKTTSALILNTEDFGESNKNLIVYTKEFGKIIIFAKSVREHSAKLTSFVVPYKFLEIVFIKGKRNILKEAKEINPFFSILGSQTKYKFFNSFLSILDEKTSFYQKDTEMFEILKWFLNNLENNNKETAKYTYLSSVYFLLNCLGLIVSKKNINKDEFLKMVIKDKQFLKDVRKKIEKGMKAM